MAEHVLATRIQLRYDTLNNWLNSDEILMAGEMAVAKVEYATSINYTNSTPANTPPSFGLKVGDGRRRFYELPWVQAVAGDVYSWAKQQNPPSASNIPGLADFIGTYISENYDLSGGGSGGGSGGDTPVAARIYQLVAGTGLEANRYYLQYRTADSNEWTIDTAHYIDLSYLAQLMAWIGEDIEYASLASRIYSTVSTELRKLEVEDEYEPGKVVVAVTQNKGKILSTKREMNLNDFTGPLAANLGGTGYSVIPENGILVGNINNGFTMRLVESEVDDTTNLVTSRAVKRYVDTKTAGLTGAMHYIGEATVDINPAVNPRVNPNIGGYDFSKAQYGDVVTSNFKEFIWAGEWRLLGDEGSYAIKGNIVNADINAEAAIDQSKIFNLVEDLADKVTKVEGMGLSTNDYTNADKLKLTNIEEGAQVNVIEHIYVNDIERPIQIINGTPKSIALSIDVFDEEHAAKLDGIQAGAQVNAIEHIFVNGEERPIVNIGNITKAVNIVFNPYTTADQQKLANIEAEAQVNKIEKIIINNSEYTPDEFKRVNITIDQAALNLDVLAGARIPGTTPGTYIDVDVTEGIKKLDLARIAATGNVKDLLQSNDEYVILYCGTSTDVI